MRGLVKVFETAVTYYEEFFNQIEVYGLLGYSIDDIKEILEPSCTEEEIAQVMKDLNNQESYLSKMYRNGIIQARVERDQLIASNDKDSSDAVLKAIEIRREELLGQKINEYYGL